jgi:transposase
MTAARYQEQVLDKVLHDFYQSMAEERGQVLFQQDGAPSHTAKSTGQWLDQNEIKIMPHPPGSPDLNPIEPLWHTLKEKSSKERASKVSRSTEIQSLMR